MYLFIVRHAEALPSNEDPQMGLSPRGREQATDVGQQIAGLGLKIPRIQHSHKARAQQTAELVAAALPGAPVPEARDGLKPNDPVEPLVREILDSEDQDNLLVVSHLPFVQYLTAVLMSHKGQDLPAFPTAGAVVMVQTPKTGGWSILHVLAPRT